MRGLALREPHAASPASERPQRSQRSQRSQRRRPVLSRGFSQPGLVMALLFFALSLLPSMLPRSFVVQGVVSGITVMTGYALGVIGQWAWNFLRLPELRGTARRVVMGAAVGIAVLAGARGVWQHVGWQNSVRAIYPMEPISPIVLIPVFVIAATVAALILYVARGLRQLFTWGLRGLDRVVPHRLALLLGGVAVAVFFTVVVNGVLVNGFFTVSNQVFAAADRGVAEGLAAPSSELRSGGPGSLTTWESLGRKGRAFVSTGPSVADLDGHHGGGALEPIRVYAGVRSAPSVQARADLVLGELVRTGAFGRKVLVVGVTTGTGFLDPRGIEPLEYLYNGDTAVVGVQYSYLPSWISLLADRDEVQRTARVVFDTIQEHWETLPAGERPELYLYGLSLGAFGAESILTSIDVVNEPVDGALLAGPPFMSELWREVVAGRAPGTPPWRPVYRDGRTVRFMGEEYGGEEHWGEEHWAQEHRVVDVPEATWGPTRIVYLQHASDPVVFFSPDLVVEQPDWLEAGQRGPGIADEFVYVPFVTMWQVFFDLASAGSVPVGWGHLYSSQANAAAWIALTRPDDWTAADTRALMDVLGTRDVVAVDA